MARRFTRRRWRRPQRMTLEGPPIARRKDVVVFEPLTLEADLAWRENRRRMALLLIGFLALAAVEGLVVGLLTGAVLLALPVAVGLAFAYLVAGARYGDGWMRGALGATTPSDPLLSNLLDGVATRAGIPPPELLVVPGEAPNALALGLRRRWIVVTSGASRLGRLEMEAVLAHEALHLRDGDSALASAFVLLGGAPELATRGLRHPGGILGLLSVPLWPVCLVVRGFRPVLFGEDREHRADVAGTLLTSYPPGMVKALTAAGVEQGSSTLRSTDPFWFAPRAPGRGHGVARRAELVSEM